MNCAITKLFEDEQYCIDEIQRIRQTLGDKRTATKEAFEAAISTLGFMLIHCPEDFRWQVESQLHETTRRQVMLMLI
jgi:hypothetical protein